MFEALKESGMFDELGETLTFASNWPAPALALLVILTCKLLSEMASGPCSVYCLLPAIAKVVWYHAIIERYKLFHHFYAVFRPRTKLVELSSHADAVFLT